MRIETSAESFRGDVNEIKSFDWLFVYGQKLNGKI
jgi:hypothetical protein